MFDALPPQPPAETILVAGRPMTAAAGAEAFGSLQLEAEALIGASGRVEDALRALGGVQLFRTGSTRTANPTAEGITARGLAGNAASRLLVTLDGVPITDPFFGFVAWGNLIGRPLDRAELVRGGGLGGPGALAGTLALTSAPARTEGRARLGSRGSAEGSAALAVTQGEGILQLFGGLSRGDGHLLVAEPGPADVAARYRQWAAGARGTTEAAGLQLAATVSAFDDRRLRGIEGANIRSKGGDASLSLSGRGGWAGETLLFAQLRDFATVTRTLDTARATATTALDQLKTPAIGWGARLSLEPPLSDSAALRLGAEWRAAEGQTTERFRYVAGNPTRFRRAGGSQETGGIFGDASLRVSPELLLTAAARLDRWRIGAGTLDEIELGTGFATLDSPSPARTGTEASGRLGTVWRPLPALRLRGAAYAGWRLPTLNELHRPFRVGQDATAANPALQPERLRGAEASVGFTPLASIDLRLTGYVNQLRDPIANVTLGQGPGLFPGVGFVPAGGRYRQRRNLRAIDSSGIEGDARIEIGALAFSGSLAWTDARVRGGELEGRRPAQAPEWSGSLGARWEGEGGRFSAALRHTGGRFEDDQNNRRLGAATLVDLQAGVAIGRGIWLEAAVENLGDARAESGFSGSQIELGQPRTLWLGLAFKERGS